MEIENWRERRQENDRRQLEEFVSQKDAAKLMTKRTIHWLVKVVDDIFDERYKVLENEVLNVQRKQQNDRALALKKSVRVSRIDNMKFE